MGGFFDLAIHGGGDSANAAAFGGYDVCWPDASSPAPDVMKHRHVCNPGWVRLFAAAYASEYSEYYSRVRASAPRVTSAAQLLAVHHWHGSRSKRQLHTRFQHFQNVSSMSDILALDDSGIWALRTAESDAARQLNDTLCAYFRARGDDDVRD